MEIMRVYYKNGGFYQIDDGDELPANAVALTTEAHLALLTGQADGQQIVEGKDGLPRLAEPSPSDYHTWDGETWVITPEQQAVKNAAEIAKMRQAINALRDRKINGGVYVEPLDKWLDTDATAERNLLSAKSSFDLFGDAVGEIAWTCADNSILMLNKAKLIVIWQALMTAKTGNHANALRHKTAAEQAENPLEYDYSDGWTKTYEEYLNEQNQ
ncbi:DUF4376 domain-containing protein [Mannheimia pernigra]|uniref:DUF4376 domain-containing protein n=1 Tax=Mannheimia pernigra TaxID=111844 RepID=UPI00336A6EF5